MTEGPGKVKFTCTDKGRHNSRLLGEAEVTAEGVMFTSRGPSTARDGRGRPRRSNTFAKTDRETGEDYAVYRLMCPSCPLHVEWRRDRAEEIACAAVASGKKTFDLSLMF